MQNAPLLFLLYFTLQFSLLNIIRKINKRGQRPDLRADNALCTIRQCPDDLDYEILSAKQNRPPLKSGLNILSAPQNLLRLFYKRPGQLPHSRFSSLNRLLAAMAYPPLNSYRLKEEILTALKAQYCSGGLPDYFNGDYYINGNGGGALALPLAVSAYIDYSGDKEILSQKICYNRYGFKPLSKIVSASLCQSVYAHVLKAIESFSLNGNGLLNIKPQGFETCIVCDNIISTLIFCEGVDNFINFAEDAIAKLKLARVVLTLRKNAVKACRQNYCKCFGTLKMLCAAAEESGETIENYSAIPAAAIILYAKTLARRGDALSPLNALANRNISLTESLLLKNALINIMGIGYKNGALKVKPACHKYKAVVFTDGASIVIQNEGGGVVSARAGGITFNNVDYVKLKGYNKNITITV